jgi:uncharacterized surface protein with fasciclin (FAS1) repeats
MVSMMLRVVAIVLTLVSMASAFQVATAPRALSRLRDGKDGDAAIPPDLEAFCRKEFPAFHSLLSLNKGIWKTIAGAEKGCTIFAPSDLVFDALGEKKLEQLKDNRNEETAQKMGLYHVVDSEAVTATRLRTEDWTRPAPADGSPRPITVQALTTVSGEVPVGRGKSGGFFGFLAKEDGDIVIGPNARIVKSYKVAGSIVHEVDALISPMILWRYCDQLRIPGF